MSNDIIRKALGMDDNNPREESGALIPYDPQISETNEELDRDVAFARENMIDLIGQSSEAIAELLMVAKQSQHPRAYEVVANLLKVSSELNGDLVDLHKKKQSIQPKENRSTTPRVPGTVNNNLFVGSTAELQRMLIDMSKNNEPK